MIILWKTENIILIGAVFKRIITKT